MEQDRIKLFVITNQKELLIKQINKYNQLYGTDFALDKFVQDEVNYAFISYLNVSPNQVFDFGYHFGNYMQFLIEKKYIDFT